MNIQDNLYNLMVHFKEQYESEIETSSNLRRERGKTLEKNKKADVDRDKDYDEMVEVLKTRNNEIEELTRGNNKLVNEFDREVSAHNEKLNWAEAQIKVYKEYLVSQHHMQHFKDWSKGT